MTHRQASDKLLRSMIYLKSTYSFGDERDAIVIFNGCRYELRRDIERRTAGRKAARKFGEACRMTLVTSTHPIDYLSEQEAVKLARKAASNAFWAHPELREL